MRRRGVIVSAFWPAMNCGTLAACPSNAHQFRPKTTYRRGVGHAWPIVRYAKRVEELHAFCACGENFNAATKKK